MGKFIRKIKIFEIMIFFFSTRKIEREFVYNFFRTEKTWCKQLKNQLLK